MRVLVTGSNGLIGSEAVVFFDQLGAEVVGVDNNMRAVLRTRWRHSVEPGAAGKRGPAFHPHRA